MKTNMRGIHPPESIRGVESVRDAIRLIKIIMKDQPDHNRRSQVAKAGLTLNNLLLK